MVRVSGKGPKSKNNTTGTKDGEVEMPKAASRTACTGGAEMLWGWLATFPCPLFWRCERELESWWGQLGERTQSAESWAVRGGEGRRGAAVSSLGTLGHTCAQWPGQGICVLKAKPPRSHPRSGARECASVDSAQALAAGLLQSREPHWAARPPLQHPLQRQGPIVFACFREHTHTQFYITERRSTNAVCVWADYHFPVAKSFANW